MKYSKKQIEQYSKETNFIKHYIEKVVRLIDILDFLFSKSSFKEKMVLKGGTAINLVHTNLKRLSVDIDLDYCGSIDKEIMLVDRRIIEEELDKHMLDEKYEISPKSRNSYALLSKTYRYRNTFGNMDTIKVDINFMDRVHLYPTLVSTVTYFDKTVTLKTPAIEELFGMKINALLDRSKPRDLYDTAFLVNNLALFDNDRLRKAIIFYLSLNGIFELNNSSFDEIGTISRHDIKIELQPVLKKDERFVLEEAMNDVVDILKTLLKLNNDEKQYLKDFSKGNYRPSLLFDDLIASKIENHPMAKWIAENITK